MYSSYNVEYQVFNGGKWYLKSDVIHNVLNNDPYRHIENIIALREHVNKIFLSNIQCSFIKKYNKRHITTL